VNRYYSGSAFGTFVNRDHYSAFLEMIFPLSLGYFLARADYFSLPPGLSLRQKMAWFGQEKLQKINFYLFCRHSSLGSDCSFPVAAQASSFFS